MGEEGLPADDDPVDIEQNAGYCDGMSPPWPAAQMLYRMPDDVEELGDEGASPVSGSSLIIDPASEHDVVRALTGAGYACNRDDHLVELASGYSRGSRQCSAFAGGKFRPARRAQIAP